jgi:hypothetical protein
MLSNGLEVGRPTTVRLRVRNVDEFVGPGRREAWAVAEGVLDLVELQRCVVVAGECLRVVGPKDGHAAVGLLSRMSQVLGCYDRQGVEELIDVDAV